MKKVFAIYDSKAAAYLNPILTLSVGEMLRNFIDATNDPKTFIHKHPQDYSLFEIGSYNDLTGELTPLKTFRNVANAWEILENERTTATPVLNGAVNKDTTKSVRSSVVSQDNVQ